MRMMTSSHPAAGVAGDDPERDADERRDRERLDRNAQGCPGAEDDAAEDVAPDLIRSEVMRPARREQAVARGGSPSRRPPGRSRSTVRRPPSAPRARRAQRRARPGARDADRRPARRRRPRSATPRYSGMGWIALTSARPARADRSSDCRMSTSRLAITYASATNSVTPRIAGVSSDWIAATAYEPSPGQL